MNVYPYFIECSKRENGFKKNQLQKLALGIGGLIIKRNSDYYLVVNNGEFKIPLIFSVESYSVLSNVLWPSNAFTNLQNLIFNTKKNWYNVKKKERLVLIDKYVLKMCKQYPLNTQRKAKAIITMALILKLICPSSINYSNNEINSLRDVTTSKDFVKTFNEQYFDQFQFQFSPFDKNIGTKLQTTVKNLDDSSISSSKN
jgi:hypothetical protein